MLHSSAPSAVARNRPSPGCDGRRPSSSAHRTPSRTRRGSHRRSRACRRCRCTRRRRRSWCPRRRARWRRRPRRSRAPARPHRSRSRGCRAPRRSGGHQCGQLTGEHLGLRRVPRRVRSPASNSTSASSRNRSGGPSTGPESSPTWTSPTAATRTYDIRAAAPRRADRWSARPGRRCGSSSPALARRSRRRLHRAGRPSRPSP